MSSCLGSFGNWWIFPLIMVGMMIFCILMMRGRMGPMMCGPAYRGKDMHGEEINGSALDILNRRYVRGEIDKQEYEEKKRAITS